MYMSAGLYLCKQNLEDLPEITQVLCERSRSGHLCVLFILHLSYIYQVFPCCMNSRSWDEAITQSGEVLSLNDFK